MHLTKTSVELERNMGNKQQGAISIRKIGDQNTLKDIRKKTNG